MVNGEILKDELESRLILAEDEFPKSLKSKFKQI